MGLRDGHLRTARRRPDGGAPRQGDLEPEPAGSQGAQPFGAERQACEQFTYFEATLAVHDQAVLAVGGGPQVPLSVIKLDALTGDLEVLRRSTEEVPDSDYLPLVQEEQFIGPGGRDVHAFVYAPRNPMFSRAGFERPPYLLMVHGGPTAQASPVLDLEVAYFTSRGIGVADVDYGSSAGYGREYRRRLCGRWGVLDVEDVVAVARGLVERDQADRRKLLIHRRESAGGWTVLVALTRTEVLPGACPTTASQTSSALPRTPTTSRLATWTASWVPFSRGPRRLRGTLATVTSRGAAPVRSCSCRGPRTGSCHPSRRR